MSVFYIFDLKDFYLFINSGFSILPNFLKINVLFITLKQLLL